MTSSGDVADEVVRMALTGAEVTLRLTASATKNLLAMTMALAKSHKQLVGKSSMRKMLKSTRDIRVFSMTKNQLKAFEKQAKKFGLLYSVIRDKGPEGRAVDVVLPATELDRANAVFEKIRYGQESRDTNENLDISKGAEHTPERAKTPERSPERARETDPKNVSRSKPDWTATSDRAGSAGTNSARTTPEMAENWPSISAQLEKFRRELAKQKASTEELEKGAVSRDHESADTR